MRFFVAKQTRTNAAAVKTCFAVCSARCIPVAFAPCASSFPPSPHIHFSIPTSFPYIICVRRGGVVFSALLLSLPLHCLFTFSSFRHRVRSGLSGLVKIGKIGELKRHIYPLRSIGVLGQWGKGERELLRAEEKYLPKLANDLPKVSYCIEPLCCGFAVFSYRLKTHTHARTACNQERFPFHVPSTPFFICNNTRGEEKKNGLKTI